MDFKIRLAPITVENWKACAELELSPDQGTFLPSNLYSIAEAHFYPESVSNAVYNLDDELVGYVLYGRDVSTQNWKIFRLMVDRAYQGRGYGEAVMKAVIKTIFKKPDGDEVLIRYHQKNQAAKSLYTGLGFEELEVDEGGIVTALLKRDGI